MSDYVPQSEVLEVGRLLFRGKEREEGLVGTSLALEKVRKFDSITMRCEGGGTFPSFEVLSVALIDTRQVNKKT